MCAKYVWRLNSNGNYCDGDDDVKVSLTSLKKEFDGV